MTERTVTTRGTGRETAPAEEARIELDATGTGTTADRARSAAEDVTATLRRALEETPVETDLRAEGFRLEESDEFFGDVDAPYRAVRELVVRCPPDRAGDVIATAAGTGVTVSVTTFGLTGESRDALYDRALEAAMADARRKAGVAANAEGLSVEGLREASVDERDGFDDIVDEALNGETELDPSPVAVEVEVEAEYDLR